MTDKQTTNPDINHAAIERHYAHACAKHPHFCDLLTLDWGISTVARTLLTERKILADQAKEGRLEVIQIIRTEVAEIVDAYVRHDYAAAVEECHDAIAVLLRMAKMIADEGASKCAEEGEVA